MHEDSDEMCVGGGDGGGGGVVNVIRILNRFQGWGVRLTAEYIALTIAVKY